MQSHDVLILGAGVAGCATALALKQLNSNLDILIVERRSEIKKLKGKEIRVGETLPPHAAVRLKELGLWKSFQKANFQRSYGTSAVWGTNEMYHNEFIASPYGYGWHIDRDKFDQLLIDQTLNAGIEIRFETSLLDFEKEGQDNWELKLKEPSGGSKVSSKMLVDASGKKAWLASKFGAKKLKSDQLIGIIREYDSSNNQFAGSGAIVEAVDNGWWYSSVLTDDSSIVCFMTDADISKKENIVDEDHFQQHLSLTKYTKQRVGHWKSGLQIKAAHTQILDSVVGDGWLAVGDSASGYDPLSALGVFKALNMSKFASFAIMNFLQNNKTGLKKYEQIVKSDFRSFLEKKNDYYNEEKRFLNNPFWSRRKKNASHFNPKINAQPSLETEKTAS